MTQYPASYTNETSIFDPTLHPNTTFPGRTYRWYIGEPVLPFGYGLHYTNLTFSWEKQPQSTYSIQSLVNGGGDAADYLELAPFVYISITVNNTGGPANMASDYVGLLFLSSSNAGPEPRPNKTLVSYARAHDIPVGGSQVLSLPVNLGSLARADDNGDLTVYPGDYVFSFDIDFALSAEFQLTGDSAIVDTIPRQAAQYNYTVPVYPQA